jgi:hypothetical protein
MNLSQYKALVVVPVLTILGAVQPKLNSPAAINLLTGTPDAESNFDYLAQFPSGPAIGFDEIELDTLNDQYNTFLDYPENVYLKAGVDSFLFSALTREDQLHGNMYFGVAVSRIKYWRVREPLPAADDAVGLATYHKTWFNTAGGAASIETNTPKFQAAINA